MANGFRRPLVGIAGWTLLVLTACGDAFVEVEVTATESLALCLGVHRDGEILADQRYESAEIPSPATITLVAGAETGAVDVSARELEGARSSRRDQRRVSFDGQFLRMLPLACGSRVAQRSAGALCLGMADGVEQEAVQDGVLTDVDADGRDEPLGKNRRNPGSGQLERPLDLVPQTGIEEDLRGIGSGFLTCTASVLLSNGRAVTLTSNAPSQTPSPTTPSSANGAVATDVDGAPAFALFGPSGLSLWNLRSGAPPTQLTGDAVQWVAVGEMNGDRSSDFSG